MGGSGQWRVWEEGGGHLPLNTPSSPRLILCIQYFNNFTLKTLQEICSIAKGKYFILWKYQEVHPCSTMNIDSVKINASLIIRDYEVDGSFRS